jgi:uncharacterized membrane protein YdjX (TVP38/TMEM64 family)
MKQDVLQLFGAYPGFAILISIGLNVIIAILGVVPSIFLTAANVLFFGFWPGTLISFAGECIGNLAAFVLYRQGFKRKVQNAISKYPPVQKLLYAQGKDAFYAIVSLRLIPFIPSGIITFAAAVGKVRLTTFFVASSAGKIPAIFIEAYAAYQVTAFGWQGKLILLLAGIYFLYLFFKRRK